MTETKTSVAIIGGGPAGLSAAIYAARAHLKPICIMGISSSSQLLTTTAVENFPGYTEIQGPKLVENMTSQAESCGATLLYSDVNKVDLTARPFRIEHGWDNEIIVADTLIIATGSHARRLDVPGEQEFWQKGVSACAVCDSFMAEGNVVAVVGGGDVAVEEATYLTKMAKKVYLIHRRGELRASKAMADRVLKTPGLEMLWHRSVSRVLGDKDGITGIELTDPRTGEVEEKTVGALYWAVGHIPATSFLRDTPLELTPKGYIKLTDAPSARTNIPGVFAAGDVADWTYRQAIVAAGSGCKAALDAERFLAAQE
eukprot:gnl/Dysnectes_brevis/911_a1012_2348.p1 GENE.gnl/Dysnectes_brevis/911_a1012_2348~~gnl/Dysnectes_brevis/911_a1012_2348.p1  ORF type:complete len:314 (-),score=136.07 gnl/Dysnectes_brevis/911_a1012_2348:1112-2053(-)